MPDKLKTELADEHTTNLAYQNDDPDQKEYSEDLAPPDTQDSYIYGDADATEEDTLETMTVYDPDGERFEELEDNLVLMKALYVTLILEKQVSQLKPWQLMK